MSFLETNYKVIKWDQLLQGCKNDDNIKKKLKLLARRAYDEFDLVSRLAINGGVPDFLYVLVAGYRDSIPACWKQGECFFLDRVKKGRKELYRPFSVVYQLAEKWNQKAPMYFPRMGAHERAYWWWKRRQCFKEARKTREILLQEGCGDPKDA